MRIDASNLLLAAQAQLQRNPADKVAQPRFEPLLGLGQRLASVLEPLAQGLPDSLRLDRRRNVGPGSRRR